MFGSLTPPAPALRPDAPPCTPQDAPPCTPQDAQPCTPQDAQPCTPQDVRDVEVPAEDAQDRFDAIVDWIGVPGGRGRIVAAAPLPDVEQEVRVWEADGGFGTRRIRTGPLLGAGLAGTVYEVRDADGTLFVEKHYGEIPAHGAHRFGRWLTALLFSLFRQAPLSFRELPAAVIVIHLMNRVIVAASAARFGRSITPPLLYTRYDQRTGGYVQAFTHVAGRPMRPFQPGLSLLGDAGALLPVMRTWRAFLTDDLGFWGLARQIDPTNVNAYSNVWLTPQGNAVLLDLVPGVCGFLEPRYLWWGIRRGQFAPFADAVDFARLSAYLTANPLTPVGRWDADRALLTLAVRRWQAAEPRLVASPARFWRVLTDRAVRAPTRWALLTHLEVKGAISQECAARYAVLLADSGTFPGVVRHSMLKMAPYGLHRALTDAGYLRSALRRAPRLVGRVVAGVAGLIGRLGRRLGVVLVTLGRNLASRPVRVQGYRTQATSWIESERRLGRLTTEQGAALQAEVDQDEDTADLAGLFTVHLIVSGLKHSLFGPSAVWFTAAAVTGNWLWALPAGIAPALRLITAVALGFGRRPVLLMLCLVPDVGVLAAPLYLLRMRPELGNFIIRVFVQRAALGVPAFGQRGGLLELVAVGVAQVLIVETSLVFPVVVAVTVLAVINHLWWLVAVAIGCYLAAVVRGLLRHCGRRVVAAEVPTWSYGMPAPTL